MWARLKASKIPREGDIPAVSGFASPKTIRFHGSKKELPKILDAFEDFSGSSRNVYGPGLYTTSSKGVAKGYGKKKAATVSKKDLGNLSDMRIENKGFLYQITPKKEIKLFDLDHKVPPAFKSMIMKGSDEFDMELAGFLRDNPKASLVDLYDEARGISRYVGLPTYEVSEKFHNWGSKLQDLGYQGLRHKGGTLSGLKKKHEVNIFFEPSKSLQIKKMNKGGEVMGYQQGGGVMNKYLQQTPQADSTDTVPAMLTPGEFVIRKDAADEIGRDKLHAMNNIDRLSGMSAVTNYKPAKFQEGGDVMNYFGGGMVRNAGAGYQEGGAIDTLRVFGDKSRSADDLSAMAAMEMLKAQSPPSFQYGGPVPPMQQQGMMSQQALPPAGFMQQGGVVRQPMPTGEPAGMQERPVPQGERAYSQKPQNQLNPPMGLDPYQFTAYEKYGPAGWREKVTTVKPKSEWTPYDAMVDAGIVNPNEEEEDDFKVRMAREAANGLRLA